MKGGLRKGNAHPAPVSPAPTGGVVVGKSRAAWLRSVHGEAGRIGRVRSANWELLASALARRLP